MMQQTFGWWQGSSQDIRTGDQALQDAVLKVGCPVFLIDRNGTTGVSHTGMGIIDSNGNNAPADSHPLTAFIPPLPPSRLGDPQFKKSYGLRYAYVTGAMANGIASVEMVRAAGQAGMLGFFGAGGLSLEQINQAIERLQGSMEDKPFGFNLIHSPNDPDLENGTVQLYLDRGVRLVSAAAYLRLTPALVYYRVKGIHRNLDGRIICPNRVIAKISRIEVARQFFSPPPAKILKQLLAQNKITPQEADLAQYIPVADTMTAEADSGGHTDNRPALALLPAILSLKNHMAERHRYQAPLYVGLGGGIATPESAAAAFAMGAAYILTGTVNQACIESGTSEAVRKMLTEAGQADVTMAPSADMFQMGVKVQVLKRGTMFPVRAAKLYDLYSRYDCFEDIPAEDRETLEKNFFKTGFETEWTQTRAFFMQRDPRQVTRAETDAKHKMALVFRSYLGRSSGWAVSGDPARKMDYQVWCGPAIGAFNEWVKGSFLEKPENRKTALVGLNILLGASVITRLNWLRNQGLPIREDRFRFDPLPDEAIAQYLTD